MNVLKIVSSIGKEVNGDEFKVFFYICNTLNLNKTTEMEINRARIAELAGWWNEDRPKYSMNKVSKITASLVEKGLIKKRILFDKETTKRTNLYSIPLSNDGKHLKKDVEKSETLVSKNRASNNINNMNKINNMNTNEYEQIELTTEDKLPWE